jgi:hypothetical protein
VIDSAGYGPVTISNSVSIIAPPGIYAGITIPPSEPFAGVNIGSGNFNVTLRGLTITGSNGPASGIRASSTGTLDIDSCVIANVNTGIYVPSTSGLKASITRTVVSDTSFEGIYLTGNPGPLTATIDGSPSRARGLGLRHLRRFGRQRRHP